MYLFRWLDWFCCKYNDKPKEQLLLLALKDMQFHFLQKFILPVIDVVMTWKIVILSVMWFSQGRQRNDPMFCGFPLWRQSVELNSVIHYEAEHWHLHPLMGWKLCMLYQHTLWWKATVGIEVWVVVFLN